MSHRIICFPKLVSVLLKQLALKRAIDAIGRS